MARPATDGPAVSDPRDEPCTVPGCDKTVRQHIEEGKRYIQKFISRSETLKAQTARREDG